jgi:hypothetical protein
MTTTVRIATVAAIAAAASSPLTASAGVLARAVDGPSDASAVWHLLGSIAPVALWGLPLAYVVFTVTSLLPRHPKAQAELEQPREATFVDRLSLFTDSRDGW